MQAYSAEEFIWAWKKENEITMEKTAQWEAAEFVITPRQILLEWSSRQR